MRKTVQKSRHSHPIIIAVDVGNTSITVGALRKNKILRIFQTVGVSIPYFDDILRLCGRYNSNYKVVISSVNPIRLKKLMSQWSQRVDKENFLLIGRNIKPKIQHKYNKLNKLGQDRLVNIYGALKRFRLPVVIFDFGTAITVDFINEQGVFEGGLIVPGLEISKEALEKRTALLPSVGNVEMIAPTVRSINLVGRNTQSCMKLGLLQGFGAMVDGLIERYRSKFGQDLNVLACGGFAKILRPFIRHRITVDRYHTLKSISMICDDYLNKG